MTGNTFSPPSHSVRQTTASGGVGSSHLRDPYRQKVSQSSTNHLPHPEDSGIGTHQVASEASSGLYTFHNREQVAGLSAGGQSNNIPPGCEHLVDIILLLSNLSTQSFVVHSGNLDLTDTTQAIDSGSSHPVNGQLKIDSGQSELSRLLGLNRQVKNIFHSGLNGGNHLNSKGTRGLQHQYKPLHLPVQAQFSPGQSDKCETYPSGKPQPTILQGKVDPLRSASPEQVSSTRSQSVQSLERPGSTEWSNTDMLPSKVHNVRVKPPSRFVSSVNPLRQKPMVQPLNSASTVLSSQGQMADRGQEGKQVQTVNLYQTSTHVSPNQQMPLHNPLHSPSSQNLFHQVAGTEYDGWMGYATALRHVQAAGRIGTA